MSDRAEVSGMSAAPDERTGNRFTFCVVGSRCSLESKLGATLFWVWVWSCTLLSLSLESCSFESEFWSHALLSLSLESCSLESEFGVVLSWLWVWSHALLSLSLKSCSLESDALLSLELWVVLSSVWVWVLSLLQSLRVNRFAYPTREVIFFWACVLSLVEFIWVIEGNHITYAYRRGIVLYSPCFEFREFNWVSEVRFRSWLILCFSCNFCIESVAKFD